MSVCGHLKPLYAQFVHFQTIETPSGSIEKDENALYHGLSEYLIAIGCRVSIKSC